MKKLYFNLLAIVGAFLLLGIGSANAFRIYYTNPNGWTTPHVHIWNTNNGTNTSNPVPMTRLNESNLWYIDRGSTNCGLLFADRNYFNDSETKKTGDINNISDNNVYCDDSSIGSFSNFKLYTINYDNSVDKWGTVYAYIYSSSNKNLNKYWPGEAMKKGSNDIWSYTFYAPTGSTIIFNRGDNYNENKVSGFSDGDTYNKNGKVEAFDYTKWGVNFNINEYDGEQNYAHPNASGIVTWNNITIGDNDNFSVKVLDQNNNKKVYADENGVNIGTPKVLSAYGDISYAATKLNDGNLYTGVYNVTYDVTSNTVTLTGTKKQAEKFDPSKITALYLIGKFNHDCDAKWNHNNGNDGIKLVRSSDGKTYSADQVYMYFDKDNFFRFQTADGVDYGPLSTDNDQNVSPFIVFDGYRSSSSKAFHIENGNYDITFELQDDGNAKVTLKRHFPEVLYMYGHINDTNWDNTDSPEKMTQDENNPGYYTTEVAITGQWSEHDTTIGDTAGRTLYASTDDENYVGFFDKMAKTETYFDNNEEKTKAVFPELKYGSADYNNVTVILPKNFKDRPDSKDGNKYPQGAEDSQYKKDLEEYLKARTYSSEPTTRPLNGVMHGESYNFHVGDGTYLVEVNLSDKTVNTLPAFNVRFTRIDATDNDDNLPPTVFQWFSGDADLKQKVTLITDEHAQDGIDFQFSCVCGDRIQVGVDDSPTHRVARQVEYTVRKKIASNSPDNSSDAPALFVKRRLNEGDYQPIEEGFHYSTIGDSGYSSNHVIEFNEAGDYLVTASLTEKPEKVEGFFAIPDDSTIAVSVSAPTGVETIIDADAATDGTPVFYNLQGVRVENPDHGIFIKVVNGNAQKVVL